MRKDAFRQRVFCAGYAATNTGQTKSYGQRVFCAGHPATKNDKRLHK